MCRSTLDQESCIYADNVRKLRQHEYDNQSLYTDKESEIAAQNERSEQDFIEYFKKITYTRHPNASKSIIINWERVGVLLGLFMEGKPMPFSTINVKLLEELKMYMLTAPQGGSKKGSVSQNTASTYFSIVKAGLKQAFIDEYLTVDVSEKVKNIPTKESRREVLTIEEVNKLANTPCSNNILRRASFFSILTGLRHCDIQELKWGQIVRHNDSWRINFDQEKTDGVEYTPISDQAYELCGERRDPDRLVFEGLMNPSWINRPVKKWIEAAGITKHITFHCFRHSYATLQLTNGTDIFTVSKMLGHTNVKTTQIYAKVVDAKKEQAAKAITIENLDKSKPKE
jgi:integrase